MRNFLLDARFQLKFAGYFVVLTLLVATWIGIFLVRTTDSLYRQVSVAVDARSKVAAVSKELGTCSLNNELTRAMDDPDFAKTLEARSKAIDDAFEVEKAAVLSDRARLEQEQGQTVWILLGFLAAFIALTGFSAILLTHRIVGPLFRIKRMAREVSQGVIRPPSYGLRPGDELQDVFELMSTMVKELRVRSEADLAGMVAGLNGDRDALEKAKLELEARLAR